MFFISILWLITIGGRCGSPDNKPELNTMGICGQAAGYKPKQAVLMRFISVATLLVYLSVYVGWPFTVAIACLRSPVGGASMACTCPMCTIDAKGVHHCSCCDHNDRCECGISSDSDDQSMATFLETGIPVPSHSLPPTLASDPVILQPVQQSAHLEFNVPTPPPEA